VTAAASELIGKLEESGDALDAMVRPGGTVTATQPPAPIQKDVF
jgi:hypothetical protein